MSEAVASEVHSPTTTENRPAETTQNPMHGNTTEDLAALDRLITLLLGGANSTNNSLDSWRRSMRASNRGYRPLGTAPSTSQDIGIDTTPL